MITKVLALLIGVIILFSVFYQSFNTTANRVVSLEARNFTTNNTYYNLGNSPIYTDTYHLYYFGNTTFEIPSSRYSVTTTQVKIYANGTGDYPNVTTNKNYYSSYTWYPSLNVWGTDWTWMFGIIFIAISFVIVYFIYKNMKLN